jgi:hypothetical protein
MQSDGVDRNARNTFQHISDAFRDTRLANTYIRLSVQDVAIRKMQCKGNIYRPSTHYVK